MGASKAALILIGHYSNSVEKLQLGLFLVQNPLNIELFGKKLILDGKILSFCTVYMLGSFENFASVLFDLSFLGVSKKA